MHNPRKIAAAVWDRLTLRARRGPIGIALLGVGGWGATNAANIMRCRRFTITGVCDVQQDIARRFAGRYGTPCFDTGEGLLADPATQAVCITVPNPYHGALVRAAADAGKSVFIEKPLASTAAECRALGAYCAERGVLLQVGHQMRREPVFRAMKARLATGALGAPIFARGIYTLPRQERGGWRGDATQCPGGSMEQIGIHLVDVLVSLFGLPEASTGWARNIPRADDGPDWGHVSLRFPGPIHAEVSASFSAPRHFEFMVFCERGILATDGHVLRVSRGARAPQRERPRGVPGAIAQFDAFADCIETGKPPETGAADALAIVNVIQSMFGAEAAENSENQAGV